MNIKKYMVGYFIISIVFPLVIYLASINGNDMLKKLTAVLFFLIAIIIFFYSIRTIRYVFSNREHEIIDWGFVLRINMMVVIIFLIRYIAVCMFNITEIPKFLIQFVIMPCSLLLIFPFIKNYCLNKKTVFVSLIIIAIIIYILMPFGFKALEGLFSTKSLYLTNVFNKYYIYESVSNDWLRTVLDLIGKEFSMSIILVLINFSKFVMFCMVFLPYLVINFVLIDELSYREISMDVPKKKIIVFLVILIICLLACITMSNSGEIQLIYNIKH